MNTQRGSAALIVLLVLIILLTVLAFLYTRGIIKLPVTQLTNNQESNSSPTSSPSLQTQYDNPFDTGGQYTNPFSSKAPQNPFNNLSQ